MARRTQTAGIACRGTRRAAERHHEQARRWTDTRMPCSPSSRAACRSQPCRRLLAAQRSNGGSAAARPARAIRAQSGRPHAHTCRPCGRHGPGSSRPRTASSALPPFRVPVGRTWRGRNVFAAPPTGDTLLLVRRASHELKKRTLQSHDPKWRSCDCHMRRWLALRGQRASCPSIRPRGGPRKTKRFVPFSCDLVVELALKYILYGLP